ncbi:helix-turn-helix transcriptional regulator [Saccharopolyspora gloriosae]|uniref:helix-turn-helix domain-containing protein n=1 Tax=Saccharopolyspora gloriosae TaxID=455344 RepID=UPI0016205687|nr:helix-turn-helix transcriptional regulator [Saccharopolyspora gloriosae]
MAATTGTPRAKALSAALRDARETRGVGLRVLARRLEFPHTQILHWETGHQVPGVEPVAMILTALRVSAGERERILELARDAFTAGIPQRPTAVECERAPASIVEWSPAAVPELLRTGEYRRALLGVRGMPESDRDTGAVPRADVLAKSDPPAFEALIGETVAHEPIGSAQIMIAQLDHLIEMCARPDITIRVVPLRVGWHPGWSGPFVVHEFPGGLAVVRFEHGVSGAFVPAGHDVRDCREAASKIRDVALSPAGSVDHLVRARRQWERGGGNRVAPPDPRGLDAE